MCDFICRCTDIYIIIFCYILFKIPSHLEILCNILLSYRTFSFIVSLPDPAYDPGNGAYQEMKAEVTEVPASHLIPEVTHNLTGKNQLLLMPVQLHKSP